MPPTSRRLLVLGSKGTPFLIGSYARAFELLQHHVSDFDLDSAIRDSIRFGAAGRALFRVAPRESWIVQGNRKLVVSVRKQACDALFVPGAQPLRAGSLAQIKASVPGCRLILLWPDPLLNLGSTLISALPLFDCVASYSEAAVPLFKQLGARNVIWLPFAADHLLFEDAPISAEDRAQFDCDVCFIGNPRPERERAIRALVQAGLHVKVWGEQRWLTDVSDKQLAKSYFQGRALFGHEFFKASSCAKVCLNVIDDTNYPAANMRFFEGPACGAAMLSSSCPELDQIFKHRESVVYFRDDRELVDLARELVADEALRTRIAAQGKKLVLGEHTYVHRAKELLAAIF